MFEPGDIFATRVFGHRQFWDGTVCKNADGWNCGAPDNFRTDYCAKGEERCFHINLFNPNKPQFEIKADVIDEFLEHRPRVFENQLMTFFGPGFKEPRGSLDIKYGGWKLYGLYRVRKAERFGQDHRATWVITPHPDEWTRLPPNLVLAPQFRSLDNRYLYHCQGETILTVLGEQQNREAFDEISHLGWTREDARRLKAFLNELPDWLRTAKAEARHYFEEQRSAPRVAVAGTAMEVAFRSAKPGRPKAGGLEPAGMPAALKHPAAGPAATARGHAKPAGAGQPVPEALPEETVRGYIESVYGESVARHLTLASLTKELIILTGSPGTGKSHLATALIDDPERERTIIVPVASTWKGREDLLGYVNPISGEFEPTAFTEFMIAAERAWDAGDRRSRVVIFEEFNLSQPEHWFSDVLVRCEYPDEARKDRTIDLGGKSVRGLPNAKPAVFVTPSLFFVATVNSDHTTRALSPRVLDRASLIEINVEPRMALKRAGIELEETQLIAIERLNEVLRSKGIAFSIRSARSLKILMERLDQHGENTVDLLDIVLLQEVLSKVRLLADDPRDTDIVGSLNEWSDSEFARVLPLCTRRIARWAEDLERGLDIAQA
jgi:hypothetical protein